MLRHEIVHEIAENPRFLGESPCNDITFSKICHNLTQKKSENEKARDFTSLSMQEGAAIWKIEKLAHFEISNAICDKILPRTPVPGPAPHILIIFA